MQQQVHLDEQPLATQDVGCCEHLVSPQDMGLSLAVSQGGFQLDQVVRAWPGGALSRPCSQGHMEARDSASQLVMLQLQVGEDWVAIGGDAGGPLPDELVVVGARGGGQRRAHQLGGHRVVRGRRRRRRTHATGYTTGSHQRA